MPELPEVETMVRNLRGRATGRIEHAIVHRQNGRYLPGDELVNVRGRDIEAVTRAGKFIVFELDEGWLVCHNAMSGYWDTADNPWTFDYVEGRREATERDMRVSLHLADGTALCFHDARLFGSLRFHECGKFPPAITKLGPDALGPIWFPSTLLESCQEHPKRPIKTVLMDQSEVAGIGNIYAAEALFRAGIRPDRTAGSLTSDECKLLHASVQCVFRVALDEGLDYGKYLRVYRQADCGVCGSPISKIEIAKRSTYFCPNCQK